MSICSEPLWVSPPRLDYIMTSYGVLDAFLLLKLQNKCNIVCVFRIRGYLIHYLHMFGSERANDDLLMVDDGSGLDINLLQGPTYHVIIRHKPWSCFYLVQLRLCYVSKLGSKRIIFFLAGALWTVDDFPFQNFENLCLGFSGVCGSGSGIRENVYIWV
jgi:hypothetical protein